MIRTTRAMLPGSPSTQQERLGAVQVESHVALGGASLELADHRPADLAQLDELSAQREVGVEPGQLEQIVCECGQAPRLVPRGGGVHPRRVEVGRPRARSSSSSSSIPWSEASGVRSSCDAVATKARRTPSCWRRRACIVANPRESSPTSSRALSLGTSTSRPSVARRRAASRSLRSRRSSVVARRDSEHERGHAARPGPRPGRRAARRATADLASSSERRAATTSRPPVDLHGLAHVGLAGRRQLAGSAHPLVRRERLPHVFEASLHAGRSGRPGDRCRSACARARRTRSRGRRCGARAPAQARARRASGAPGPLGSTSGRPARSGGGLGEALQVLLAQPALERRKQRQRGHPQCQRARREQRARSSGTGGRTSAARPTSGRLQPVAGAAHGQDQLRALGLLLELLAQVTHVHVDAARIAVGGSPQIARISSWRLNSRPGSDISARAARTPRTSA